MVVLVMLQFKPKAAVLGRQRDAPSVEGRKTIPISIMGKNAGRSVLRGLDKREPRWRDERLGEEWTYVQE